MFTSPASDQGLTISAVRALYHLEGGTIPVTFYAHRPPCRWCDEPVTGTSFVHNATDGCIHIKCRTIETNLLHLKGFAQGH